MILRSYNLKQTLLHFSHSQNMLAHNLWIHTAMLVFLQIRNTNTKFLVRLNYSHFINTTNELQEIDTLNQIRSSPTQYLQKYFPDQTAKSRVGKVTYKLLSRLVSYV
jgi:hypothetical protein